jgi:hypothetical protein
MLCHRVLVQIFRFMHQTLLTAMLSGLTWARQRDLQASRTLGCSCYSRFPRHTINTVATRVSGMATKAYGKLGGIGSTLTAAFTSYPPEVDIIVKIEGPRRVLDQLNLANKTAPHIPNDNLLRWDFYRTVGDLRYEPFEVKRLTKSELPTIFQSCGRLLEEKKRIQYVHPHQSDGDNPLLNRGDRKGILIVDAVFEDVKKENGGLIPWNQHFHLFVTRDGSEWGAPCGEWYPCKQRPVRGA